MDSDKCLCRDESVFPSVVATFAILLWTSLVCVLGYWAGSHRNGEAIHALEERTETLERLSGSHGTRAEEGLLRGRIQSLERRLTEARRVRTAQNTDARLGYTETKESSSLALPPGGGLR